MNFIKDFKEKKERKENLRELVLEGIEDEHYKYVIDHMITKCLKDINTYEKNLNLDKKYSIYFQMYKNPNNNQCMRVIHHNTFDDDLTILHRPLRLNLQPEEIDFFLQHILNNLKNYNVDASIDQNEISTVIKAETTLKKWYEFYYQELQKLDYENQN